MPPPLASPTAQIVRSPLITSQQSCHLTSDRKDTTAPRLPVPSAALAFRALRLIQASQAGSDGKAKKEMTPEQLERLAKAREKALEVKRAMKSKKDEG